MRWDESNAQWLVETDRGDTIRKKVQELKLDGPDNRKRAQLEQAVLDLLRDPRHSDAVTHDA